MKYKFKEGCMWEGGPFIIETNYECSEYGGGNMCKHCHSKRNKKDSEIVWTCPRVVIAENEGGFNSTGVCLDCIIEASETIK